ncbi:hypothetical protein [Pseudomonas sp. HLS-6 TE3448]
MDVKDQRLEIRIPQQQLDELDAIRSSTDSPYTLTRSDVARMYIAQGIERHKQGVAESSRREQELSLGERLSVFFQMALMRLPLAEKKASKIDLYHNDEPTSIDPQELVRKVYEKRFFWFFELEPKSLAELGEGYAVDAVTALLDRQPNAQTSCNLEYVCEVVRMLNSIKRCMDRAEHRDGVAESIKKYSNRKGVPLEFKGFSVSLPQLNEMATLVRWVDKRSAWGAFSPITCEQYQNAILDQMLEVYRELKDSRGEIELENLQDMILDPRIG